MFQIEGKAMMKTGCGMPGWERPKKRVDLTGEDDLCGRVQSNQIGPLNYALVSTEQ